MSTTDPTPKSPVYDEYGIKRRYDEPSNYGKHNSYFDKGKYPPDWNDRREAVWSLQKYQCARCGIYKGDADGVAVHHIVHLSKGGGNQLENLAGLCRDCHALMHPDLDYVDGNPDLAPLFPDSDARNDVAVIREPNGNEDLESDLQHLAETSEPDQNSWAVTHASIPTSSSDAKRAESDLHRMLIGRGFVPRTSDYHSVTVTPVFPGLRGLVTRYKPALKVSHDAETNETHGWTGILNPERTLLFTEDGTGATIALKGGNNETVEHSVGFDKPGTEVRVSPVLEAPPLTLQTLPKYAFDATLYLSWTIIKRGIIPALLVTLFASGLVPTDSIFIGFLLMMLWFGALLTLPTVYKAMQ